MFILFAVSTKAQKIDPYAFSGSLSSGYVRVQEFNTSATLGLTGTYHRQFTSIFSMRTSVELQYLVPNRLVQVNQRGTLASSAEFASGSLLFGPYVHFRDEGYRLHLGFQIGLGYGYEAYRVSPPNNENDLGDRSWSSFSMAQSQLSTGILFPLQNKDAEMGFEVGYLVNVELERFGREVFQNGYRISFVYHYNLRK